MIQFYLRIRRKKKGGRELNWTKNSGLIKTIKKKQKSYRIRNWRASITWTEETIYMSRNIRNCTVADVRSLRPVLLSRTWNTNRQIRVKRAISRKNRPISRDVTGGYWVFAEVPSICVYVFTAFSSAKTSQCFVRSTGYMFWKLAMW